MPIHYPCSNNPPDLPVTSPSVHRLEIITCVPSPSLENFYPVLASEKLLCPSRNSHFVSASEDTRCRTMLYCYKNGRGVSSLGPSLLDISCCRTWSATLELGRRWSSSTGGLEGEACIIGLLSSAGSALANTNKTLQVSPFWFIDLHGRYCHLVHAFYQ